MSSTEREELVPDDELNGLLERWIAPGPSRVLDKRVATSFTREFSGAEGLSRSSLLPQTREEVVTMKFCSRCEEEFADKFSFCPVDGTPLTARAPEPPEPSMTVSQAEPSLSFSKAQSSITKAEPSLTVSKAELDLTEAEPSVTVAQEDWPPKVLISSRPAPRPHSGRVTERSAAASSAL